MEQLSNHMLPVAVLGYLLAMICYTAEFAFGSRGVVSRVAARTTTPARALVGAGGPAITDAELPDAPVSPAPASPPPATGRGDLWSRLALGVTIVAVLAHVVTLVTRAAGEHRVPWGNMYEFVLTLTLVGAIAWLVLVTLRPAMHPMGLFVALAEILFLGVDGMVLYNNAGPVVPALNSYWLAIHVSAIATGSGLLLIGFIPALLYLLRVGADRGKQGFLFAYAAKLPAADTLERITFRVHTFAFPVFTLGIICGAIWAESAWGRYWGWDPKETWSFIAWVVYACYLHARATPSVKRTTATAIVMVGWVTMLINLYVINYAAHGLHTYAGN